MGTVLSHKEVSLSHEVLHGLGAGSEGFREVAVPSVTEHLFPGQTGTSLCVSWPSELPL